MTNPFNNFPLAQFINIPGSIARHGFTLLAMLDAAQKLASHHFVFDDYGSISYKDLYFQAKAAANHLYINYGIVEGSKIGIAGVNSIGFTIALFACSALGADVYLLNPKQKKAYFDGVVSSHKFHLILADEAVLQTIGKSEVPCAPIKNNLGAISPLDIASIGLKFRKSKITVLSSGSSGTPKAEQRKTLVSIFLLPLLQIIYKLPLKKSNSVLISVPIFHGYGLAAFLLSIFMGKEIRLAGTFSTEATLNVLKTHSIDCWIAVPLMLQRVIAIDGLSNTSLKTIISGGDALPESCVNHITLETNTGLYNLFGTSETGICTIASPRDLKRNPGTIGKALMGIKMKIVPENGVNLKNEGRGALFVKSRWASVRRSGDYVATGDIVSKDQEGYYFYWGRKDDLMIIGGENIYPVEIESVIYSFPGITWVKVSSYHDSEFKRIAADVTVDEEIFDANGFREWLKGKLPPYMVPSSIIIRDLPPHSKLV